MLRPRARADDGIAAGCLLAALGCRADGDELARAYVGALYLLEGLLELRALRKALTAPAKG